MVTEVIVQSARRKI